MTEMDRYGTGIITPLQRDGKNDFRSGSGLVLLKSDVGELLKIKGPTKRRPGELPWRTELGVRLDVLKHRGYHKEIMRTTAQQMINQGVRPWENRIIIGPVDIEENLSMPTYRRLLLKYLPVGHSEYETISHDLGEGE